MTTSAERRAAFRLTRADAPLVLRTWHGAQIIEGLYSGQRGFVISVCEHGNAVNLKIVGVDVLLCCVPLSLLIGALTLHGGVGCAGEACTEGNPINLEVAA